MFLWQRLFHFVQWTRLGQRGARQGVDRLRKAWPASHFIHIKRFKKASSKTHWFFLSRSFKWVRFEVWYGDFLLNLHSCLKILCRRFVHSFCLASTSLRAYLFQIARPWSWRLVETSEMFLQKAADEASKQSTKLCSAKEHRTSVSWLHVNHLWEVVQGSFVPWARHGLCDNPAGSSLRIRLSNDLQTFGTSQTSNGEHPMTW